MASQLGGALLPALFAVTALAALVRHVDLYNALTEGAGEGLRAALGILPSLAVLLAAVRMLRASGALTALETLLAPAASLLGIPRECLPIALIRPLSGSAALAVAAETIAVCGADSLPGRTAAVMLGSSETTFYVLTVYFGGAGGGLRSAEGRLAVPAALMADLAGFCAAALFTRLFYG